MNPPNMSIVADHLQISKCMALGRLVFLPSKSQKMNPRFRSLTIRGHPPRPAPSAEEEGQCSEVVAEEHAINVGVERITKIRELEVVLASRVIRMIKEAEREAVVADLDGKITTSHSETETLPSIFAPTGSC